MKDPRLTRIHTSNHKTPVEKLWCPGTRSSLQHNTPLKMPQNKILLKVEPLEALPLLLESTHTSAARGPLGPKPQTLSPQNSMAKPIRWHV